MPDEDLAAVLTGIAGFTPNFASIVLEFNEALSQGRLHSLEGRNETNTTPTEFKQFAAELAHVHCASGDTWARRWSAGDRQFPGS